MGVVFLQSLSQWASKLSVDRVIMLLMAIFAVIGAIDHMLNNKRGYGVAFEEGLHSMGSLAQAVAAVYAAAPLLSRVLTPLIAPIFQSIGADASVFAGLLLSSDMGGYALSAEMASSPALGNFSGLILGGTVGSIWVFTLPIALSILQERDRAYFASGILCGLMAIPLGCFFGGCLMTTDFVLSLSTILLNTIPVFVLAILVSVGLWFQPEKTIHFFSRLGKAVTILAAALTAIAVFEQLTGILIPPFDAMMETNEAGLTGLDEGLLLCGKIALVLSGAFPMVLCIKRHCAKLLNTIGKRLNINSAASLGLLTSCVNCIPTFTAMKDMDERGKLINAAFLAGGGFALGDYLGFAAEAEPQMVLPMLGAKLLSGLIGVALAYLLAPALLKRLKEK